MNPLPFFVVWLGVGLFIALAMCVYAGHCGDDDLVALGVLVVAPLWPLLLAAIIAIAPFMIAYKLGTCIR